MVGTVPSTPQPVASAITARIRELAAAARPQPAESSPRPAAAARETDRDRATPQRTLDTRVENGVPSWKRRILDSLASELERRGMSRGSRVREGLTAENVDARITGLARELRARAQGRTGYGTPGAARIGVVVNRAM
jgi:hypothetical protein